MSLCFMKITFQHKVLPHNCWPAWIVGAHSFFQSRFIIIIFFFTFVCIYQWFFLVAANLYIIYKRKICDCENCTVDATQEVVIRQFSGILLCAFTCVYCFISVYLCWDSVVTPSFFFWFCLYVNNRAATLRSLFPRTSSRVPSEADFARLYLIVCVRRQ